MLAWFASVQSASADGSVVINEISPGDDANGSFQLGRAVQFKQYTESVELGFWRLDAESGDCREFPLHLTRRFHSTGWIPRT